MKKVIIVVFVILVILLGIMRINSDKIVPEENRQAEENKLEENRAIEEIPLGEVSKNKFKVCEQADTIYYTKENYDYGEIDKIVDIKIENGKAYITVDGEDEFVKNAFNENLRSVEKQEITGFSGIPIQFYIGEFGQDVIGEEILFIMEDGSVEHISELEMLKNEKYESNGKIEGLENIKKFEILNVSDTEGGGYVTTVAIDKDGYYYDINQLLGQMNVELKEGIYTNSDDPELHLLTLENGVATKETLDKDIGTYYVENNKVYITYTQAFDPEGNPMEVYIKEEVYRIEGDTLVKEIPNENIVYKLK